jgi:hypothetical protein
MNSVSLSGFQITTPTYFSMGNLLTIVEVGAVKGAITFSDTD